uniref:Zgc:194242 n=1 Tax=Paramormyrops kingsleyae TaxID=1676925 RepID=A0A3B3SKL0_9TELE
DRCLVCFLPKEALLLSKLSKQLGRPTQSLAGWFITKTLVWHNGVLEENAVWLCGIRPDDTVLELGHGPGLGLVAAAPLLSGPKGKLIGVDYSDYMHQLATKRVKELIACGKVTLHHGIMAVMPIPDNSVENVYHCNCYYFWPDLREGSLEILRVMKSGGSAWYEDARYNSCIPSLFVNSFRMIIWVS